MKKQAVPYYLYSSPSSSVQLKDRNGGKLPGKSPERKVEIKPILYMQEALFYWGLSLGHLPSCP